MRMIIAYLLVISLVQFCLTVGSLVGGFFVALLLPWTSASLRTIIANVCGSIAGVVCAVAFGYGIFRFVVGPDSFTLGVFLASILPLFIPIRNDFLHAKRSQTAFDQIVLPPMTELGNDMARGMRGGPWSAAIGEVVGLVLAAAWYILR